MKHGKHDNGSTASRHDTPLEGPALTDEEHREIYAALLPIQTEAFSLMYDMSRRMVRTLVKLDTLYKKAMDVRVEYGLEKRPLTLPDCWEEWPLDKDT